MQGWRIVYSDKAVTDLKTLDRSLRRQIFARLEWFVTNFSDLDPIPLHGDWKGYFKFRIADWRVIYDYNTTSRTIRVHQINRRDKVYKKRR